MGGALLSCKLPPFPLREINHSLETPPSAKQICLQLEDCCVAWRQSRTACYKVKKSRPILARERGAKPPPHLATLGSPLSRVAMKCFFSLLLFVAVSWAAKPKRQQAESEWDYRSEAAKVNMKGCANLTLVLDNWQFAIMSQIKNLLLFDHQTVLPDYGRIKPLSDALDDLYKEFNALKERLGELTTRFEGVESFVDEMNKGQSQSAAKTPIRVSQPEAEKATIPLPAKRRRVLVQNGRKRTEPLRDATQ